MSGYKYERIRFQQREKEPIHKTTKKQVTINLSEDVIAYFKEQSKETGIPYQTLINLYLLDCAKTGNVWRPLVIDLFSIVISNQKAF